MRGTMMDRPLLISQLLWRAEHVFAEKEVITRLPGGGYRTATYAEVGLRARKLAQALARLGVRPGDRVGSLAWNGQQHFEAYFGVPCSGAVLHTINLRLFPEQIAAVVNDAEDAVLLVSADQVPVVEKLADGLRTVRAYVVLDGPVPPTTLQPVHAYEELIEAEDGVLSWPEFDENTAAIMCYTSATTGDPKGVAYSHRSVVLNCLNLSLHGSYGIREDGVFFSVSPMFHVNGWGVPHSCTLQGATLVFPGPRPSADDLLQTISDRRVTHVQAAVTVGVMMRDALLRGDRADDLSAMEVLWLGGQAPSAGLISWWREQHGVRVCQAWGMTEATLATFTTVKRRIADAGTAAAEAVVAGQGLAMPLVELRIVDDAGRVLPWDGTAAGELQLRGPTVAGSYHRGGSARGFTTDGWLRTGDIGTIDADGGVQLVDRTADLIKSGGEWISSVQLENALMAHPQVVEAAVVAIPDERWLERPLACVVTRAAVTAEELRDFLAARFARWQLPAEYVVLPEIPKTGIGKFDKRTLRARFAEAADREALRAPNRSGP